MEPSEESPASNMQQSDSPPRPPAANRKSRKVARKPMKEMAETDLWQFEEECSRRRVARELGEGDDLDEDRSMQQRQRNVNRIRALRGVVLDCDNQIAQKTREDEELRRLEESIRARRREIEQDVSALGQEKSAATMEMSALADELRKG
jgi:hypothetical protein